MGNAAMLAAIRKKRGEIGSHEQTHHGKADEDKIDSDKAQDKADRSEAIIKGKPSTEEKGKIMERMAQENSEQDQGGGGVDSDAIAMDMLDSRFKNNAPTKPRNLHERVQMEMAKNLKSKGKI